MKIIDENGLKLCKIQAELFADSLSRLECSSPIFIRRFMNSKVAQRMDSESFLFESCDIDAVFEELNDEFGISTYGKEKFFEQEIYWIGYLYRYWCCVDQKSSKQIYRIIKPKELRDLYYPYHSLDPSQAIERIKEVKGNDDEEFLTKKGVEIMRKAIKRERTGS